MCAFISACGSVCKLVCALQVIFTISQAKQKFAQSALQFATQFDTFAAPVQSPDASAFCSAHEAAFQQLVDAHKCLSECTRVAVECSEEVQRQHEKAVAFHQKFVSLVVDEVSKYLAAVILRIKIRPDWEQIVQSHLQNVIEEKLYTPETVQADDNIGSAQKCFSIFKDFVEKPHVRAILTSQSQSKLKSTEASSAMFTGCDAVRCVLLSLLCLARCFVQQGFCWCAVVVISIVMVAHSDGMVAQALLYS